jgi:hypothetical protein
MALRKCWLLAAEEVVPPPLETVVVVAGPLPKWASGLEWS